MRILFPSEPFDGRHVDSAFADEHEAAQRAGWETALIDLERDRVPPGDSIYRGWMLTVEEYARLYARVKLINDPEQYRRTHHYPESYALIREVTVPAVWTTSREIDFAALEPFGDRPLVLKDHVKSQKHYWDEACFIPRASDEAAVRRVVARFLELQGDSFVGGLVFREHVELSDERRIFVVDGASLSENPFPEIAARVDSRFFTMDVARRADGSWMIVELGDGQVSGLQMDPFEFYSALRR